jgi:lipoate-protein ligase A
MGSTPIRIVNLNRLDILRQLHLEEALFRHTSHDWLIVNDGVPHPAIVLGISGKPSALVHEDLARSMDVPLIKRFTGGGTVVLDGDSIMTSVIIRDSRRLKIDCFPRQIMEWTHGLFSAHVNASLQAAARKKADFGLRENDFVLGNHKVGGNAQAISGHSFLQHTSFLYDYSPELMGLLKQPDKQPEYRGGREHDGFVTRLKDVLGVSREEFVCGIRDMVDHMGFEGVVVGEEEALEVLREYEAQPKRILGSSIIAVE